MPKKQQMNQAHQDTDILRVAGILSMGYGLYPKMVAKDKRLSIESRGIYSYFCSYAGSGNTAFPRVEMICADCNISRDRYYKHFRPLVSLGYVSVTQEKITDGKFSKNIYTLNMEISISPTEKQAEQPCTCFKDTVESPCTCFPTPVNKANNINTSGSNTSSYSNKPIHSFIPSGKEERKKVEGFEKKMEEAKAIDAIIERCEIAYQNLDAKMPGMEESVTTAISEMYTADSITVKKQSLPQDKVRSILSKLSPEAILHAVEAYLTAAKSTMIKNPQQYFMSILCEAQTQATLKNAADFARMEYGSDL